MHQVRKAAAPLTEQVRKAAAPLNGGQHVTPAMVTKQPSAPAAKAAPRRSPEDHPDHGGQEAAGREEVMSRRGPVARVRGRGSARRACSLKVSRHG